jgi:antitoxin PrlF
MLIPTPMSNAYNIRSTKMGDNAGFQLPAEFYSEHPQFANADGWIEVLSPDTALLRLKPQPNTDEDPEDSIMMRLFLDFAMAEALKNNSLQPYTVEMAETAQALIEGVELEEERSSSSG